MPVSCCAGQELCLRLSQPAHSASRAVHDAGKRHRAALAAAGGQPAAQPAPAAAPRPAPAAKPSPAPKRKASEASAKPPRAKKAKAGATQDDEEVSDATLVTQMRALGAEYCLSKAVLEKVAFVTAPNPHYRSGAPMKPYDKAALLQLALSKHGGSAEGIAAAAAKRAATAAKAAATRAHNDGWRVGANPSVWTPQTHRAFTPAFRASIKCFVLCAHRLTCFGGADTHATLVQRIVKLMVESPDVRPLAKHTKAKPPRALKARSFRRDYGDFGDFDGRYGDGYGSDGWAAAGGLSDDDGSGGFDDADDY